MITYEQQRHLSPAAHKRVVGSWFKAMAAFLAALTVVSGAAYAFAHTTLADNLSENGLVKAADPGASNIDIAPAENYFFVDKSEYDGVLLGKTEDAGMDYINSTLFIGDSNTLRINMFGLLTLRNVIGIESMGINGALENRAVYFSGYNNPVTIAEAVGIMKPRRVVVSFGTNDLANGNPQNFVQIYRKFIAAMQKAYPYADIIIAAVPPFGKALEGRSFSIKTVNNYNKALIDLAKEMGLVFLDTGEPLTGSDGFVRPEYIYGDGIHLTKEGFEAIFKYARTHAHIVEDRRPLPLGKIPSQYVPVKPAEPKQTFNVYTVCDTALALFKNSGFKQGTSSTKFSKTVQFTVTFAQAKAGTEGAVGQNLYNYVLAQTGITGGYVALSGYADDANEIYVFTVSLEPHLTHTFGDWKNTRTPTCTVAGERHHTCLVCGETEKEAIPATGHTWGDWVVTMAPTETTDGSRTRTCAVPPPLCGQTETQTIPATGTVTPPPPPPPPPPPDPEQITPPAAISLPSAGVPRRRAG